MLLSSRNISNKSLIVNRTLFNISSQIIAGLCVRGTDTTVKYLLSLPFALLNLYIKCIRFRYSAFLVQSAECDILEGFGNCTVCGGETYLKQVLAVS